MEENSYVGFSIRSSLYWKYSRLRTYLHNYRQVNISLMHRNLRASRVLKGTKSGPALIAAAGPSLSYIEDSTFLQFRRLGSLFGINHYLTTPVGKSTPPNYLVLNDEPFWKGGDPSMINSLAQICEFIEAEKIDHIVQPAHMTKLFEGAKTIYFHGIPLTGMHLGHSIDRTNSIPNITLFHAIATAKYLGYSPIYLAGFDLSYTKFLVTDTEGYWLLPHHHGSGFEPRIPLSNFRRSLSDLFGSMAFQIHALKEFKDIAVQVGHASYIDTLPRITEKDLRSMIGLVD
jgi:hypothetical protein